MTAQQLKNSILQMAVQGKLVPQDPNDEPASVLLERIRTEKEKLIKEGKIKKEKNPSVIFRGEDNLPYEKVGKNEPVCIVDEVPFEIPDSWEWARLLSVCEEIGDIDHNMPKATSGQAGIPFLSAKDINDDNTLNFSHNVKYISFDDYIRLGRKMTPRLGDIVFSRIGSLGKVGVVRDNTKFLISYSCCIIRPAAINLEYLKYYLMSPIIQAHILDAKTGIGVPDLGMGEIKNCYIPIPPLNEQKRIVERLDELIPHIIQYHEKEAALSALIQDFPEMLKKSILQQAVMGKLVPQNPNDEPASVLLERIRAEKQALVKAGKLKKDKHESVIYRRDNSHYEKLDGTERCIDDEIPFEIPESWEWCRLSDLTIKEIKRGKSPIYSEHGKAYVFAQKCNVKTGGIDMTLAKFLSDKAYVKYPSEEYLLDNDIIINSTGNGTLGRIGIFHDADRIGNGVIVPDSHVTVLRKTPLVSTMYIYYVMKYYQPYLEKQGEGSTNQTELKPAVISNLLFPLPPYNEQVNIVERITHSFASVITLS